MAKALAFLILAGSCSASYAVFLSKLKESGPDKRDVCPGQSDTLRKWECERQLYMPSKDLVVCACEKCGSTTVYKYIYNEMAGKPWSDDECQGYDVHSLGTRCWNELNENGTKLWEASAWHGPEAMKNSFSFAVIRDPMERLVSSWKSKYTCDGEEYGQNDRERQFHKQRVSLLRKHAGFPQNNSHNDCMTLNEFAKALVAAEERGNIDKLDQHLVPQSRWCFDKYAPQKWDEIVNLEDNWAFVKLANHLGFKNKHGVHEHASSAKIQVDAETVKALSKYTKKDYQVLKPYLKKPTRVVPDAILYNDGEPTHATIA